MTREPDAGDLADWAADRDARRATRCQCGGDMPGRCPGPAFCPMCQSDADEEPADDEGDDT